MRSYVQQASAEQLTEIMGPGAADISEIVHNIRDKITDLETPPALEPEAARFRLFASVTTFLKNASQTQPLMLVLDDLHWADRSSLMLLGFLARQLGDSRLLLVGCYRDTELSRQHPLAETLAQLSREPVFRRQVLRGLGQDEFEHFIEATTGVHLSQELTETLYARTEGNPFFMTEVIKLLSEGGELTAEHVGTPVGLRIPESVREVIGQRLNRLSERCNEVLTTASVIGREFDFRLLIGVSGGVTEDQLLQSVDEAVSSHLIEDVPGQMDRYQFSHALVQQTLAEEVSTSRRVRLHARIGAALEELYGSDVESHAAELAHHFSEAEPVMGTAKLVRFSLLAGEQALAAYAYEEGLGHFQRALEAKGVPLSGAEPAPDQEAAALIHSMGLSQWAIEPRHNLLIAVENLTRAFAYYIEAGDTDQAVAIAESPIYPLPGSQSGMARLIGRALELIPADSHRAGRLLSQYGIAMGQAHGDYEVAQEAFSRALNIARSFKDPNLEMRILAYSANVDIFHMHWDECVDKALQAIELGREIDEVDALFLAHYVAMNGLHRLGDLPRARRHAEATLDLAERSRDRWWLATAWSRKEIVFRAEGDWQAARECSDRGLHVLPLDLRLLGNRILLEYESGDFEQGESYLDRLQESMRLHEPEPTTVFGITAAVIPMVARISGAASKFHVAEAAARTVLESQSAPPAFGAWCRIGLAVIACEESDIDKAKDGYSALEHLTGATWPFGITTDRILGLLCCTLGRYERAVGHFEDGMVICRRGGCQPEYAWTCHDYAETLLLRDSSGDRTKAVQLLDEAQAISTELEMPPLMARVSALQEQAASLNERAPAYPDGLTQREVEVLRLIAAGKTDREIAEELVIGVRTVSTHVGNILNKTNAANRTEAASYANQQGLV